MESDGAEEDVGWVLDDEEAGQGTATLTAWMLIPSAVSWSIVGGLAGWWGRDNGYLISSVSEVFGASFGTGTSTTFVVEVLMTMMSLWYRTNLRRKGREEANTAWIEWLEAQRAWESRKAEADKLGVVFPEPPQEPPARTSSE